MHDPTLAIFRNLGSKAAASAAIVLFLLSPGNRAGAEIPESGTTSETTPKVVDANDDSIDVIDKMNPEARRLYRLSLDHWLDREIRLQRIAQRLQIAGREICEENVSPIPGAVIVELGELPDTLRPLARKRFGPDHEIFVTAVFSGMASERSGLQVGDAILEVNGIPLTKVSGFYASEKGTETVTHLEIVRAGELVTLEIDSPIGCRYYSVVLVNESPNARANGDAVIVYSGMMRHVANDAMLAQLVGHELAHNIFWRESARVRDAWASRTSEARADYVGTYLAAIAGYPLTHGTYFKIGLTRPLEYFSNRRSHPTSPARELAMRKTIEEIEKQRKRGEPLRLRFK